MTFAPSRNCLVIATILDYTELDNVAARGVGLRPILVPVRALGLKRARSIFS